MPPPSPAEVDLDCSLSLETLPEWLGEMPLVYLGLEFTVIPNLPVSLGQVHVSTLRLIRTCWSLLGFDEHTGEHIGEHEHNQLDAIGRIETELLPLSAAVPQLKFAIFDGEYGKTTAGWCRGVWDPIVRPQLLGELRREIQERI
jgi:hypothetical protein